MKNCVTDEDLENFQQLSQCALNKTFVHLLNGLSESSRKPMLLVECRNNQRYVLFSLIKYRGTTDLP